MPWPWASISKRHVMDLSNEVLNICVTQGAAKISEVKIGGRKKSASSVGLVRVGVKSG